MNSMRKVFVVALALFLASTSFAAPAPPEALKLNDLINHPERLPQTVTLKKGMKFGGGKSVAAGQKVQVLEFNGSQLGVDAGNNLVFRINPNDCDLLEAANATWSKLAPAQRAVDQQMLINDA